MYVYLSLGEGCSHVAALMFKVECAVRLGHTSCTSQSCSWNNTFCMKVCIYVCSCFKLILLQKFNYSPDWAATNCWHTIQMTKMWKLDVPPLMKFYWLFSVPLILLFSVCGSVVESYWRRRQMAHSLRDLLDELAFLNIKLSTCLSVSGNLLFQKWLTRSRALVATYPWSL